MKKSLAILSLLSAWAVPVVVPITAHAVDVINPVCQQSHLSPDEQPDICKENRNIKASKEDPIFGPNGLLSTVVNILSALGAFLAVIIIIIGGTKMVVSSGDANSVASARRTVLYAVISLAIIGGAQLAVRFIINQL